MAAMMPAAEAPASPGSAQSTARRGVSVLWRPVILAAAFVLAFAPVVPVFPVTGLDYSWIQAIDQARTDGAVWGTDIVYAMGPLASLYTGAYSPAQHAQVLVLGLVYTLTAAYTVFRLTADRRWWVTVVAVAVCTSGFVSMDTVFQLPPYLLAVWVLTRPAAEQPSTWRSRHVWETAVMSVPLGMLPLVKLSGVPIAVLAIVVCVAWLGVCRQWQQAAAVGLVPPAVFVTTWTGLGQPLHALPDFVTTARYTISGYSQAMAQPGPVVDAALFVGGSVLITVVALVFAPSGSGRLNRVGLSLMTAAASFIAFKSAFVRQESHAQTGAVTLLVIALALATRVPTWPAVALVLTGGLTWLVVAHSESAVSFDTLTHGLEKS
jgi:hypothetical protein